MNTGRGERVKGVTVKNGKAVLEIVIDQVFATKEEVDNRIQMFLTERGRWISERDSIIKTVEQIDLAIEELTEAKRKL